MASIWTEIDLDEISTSDLLDELENRYLGEREQASLVELLNDSDKQKFDLFLKIKNRFSAYELEEMFSENHTNMSPSKNQLALNLK